MDTTYTPRDNETGIEQVEYCFGGELDAEFSYNTRSAPSWNGAQDTYQQYKRKLLFWKGQAEHLTRLSTTPEKTAFMMAARITGGAAKDFIDEQADPQKMADQDGEKYLLDALDSLYERDMHERLFAKYENFRTYSRTVANETRPRDANKYEHFLQQFQTKLQKLRSAAGDSAIIPEWLVSQQALSLLELNQGQLLSLQSNYTDDVKRDVTKLTLVEVQRVVRKILVPDPEIRRVKERTQQKHSARLAVREDELQEWWYDEDREVYFVRGEMISGEDTLQAEWDEANEVFFVRRDNGKGKGKGKGNTFFKRSSKPRTNVQQRWIQPSDTFAAGDGHQYAQDTPLTSPEHSHYTGGKGKGAGSTQTFSRGSGKGRPLSEGDESRGVKNRNNFKCYDCDSEYHLAGSQNCRAPSGHFAAETAAYCFSAANTSDAALENGLFSCAMLADLESTEAVLDSGCSKSMSSKTWIDRFCNTMSDLVPSRSSTSEPSTKRYNFANGESKRAEEVRKVPVVIGGQDGSLELESGDFGETPALIGVQSLRKLRATVDYGAAEDGGDVVFLKTLGRYASTRKLPGGLTAMNLYDLEGKFDAGTHEDANHSKVDGNNDAHQSDNDNDNGRKDHFTMTKDEMRQFHISRGHLGITKMKKILTDAGADSATKTKVDDVVQKCKTCQLTAPAPKHSKGGGVHASYRGEWFVGDLIYPKNAQGTRMTVMHFVDVFSRCQWAYLLSSKDKAVTEQTPTAEKTAAIAQAYRRLRRDAGLPEKLFVDGDGMLHNRDTEEVLQAYGVKIHVSGAHAPWQNGLAERHGGILKTVLKRLLSDSDLKRLPFEEVLIEATNAKNEMPGGVDVCGYSPYECYFLRKPSSHLSNEHPPALNEFSDELQREILSKQQIESLIRSTRTQRDIRRALKEQIKPNKSEFVAGEKVYFYTDDAKKKIGQSWRGPATILKIADRRAVLEFGPNFLSRSVDSLKSYSPPHSLFTSENTMHTAAKEEIGMETVCTAECTSHKKPAPCEFKELVHAAAVELHCGASALSVRLRTEIERWVGLRMISSKFLREQHSFQCLRSQRRKKQTNVS